MFIAVIAIIIFFPSNIVWCSDDYKNSGSQRHIQVEYFLTNLLWTRSVSDFRFFQILEYLDYT